MVNIGDPSTAELNIPMDVLVVRNQNQIMQGSLSRQKPRVFRFGVFDTLHKSRVRVSPPVRVSFCAKVRLPPNGTP